MKRVPYDLALKLREKGLERQLDPAGNLIGYNSSWVDKTISYYHVHFQFPSQDEFVYAPSYQEVVDWFREKKNIHIEIAFRPSLNSYRTAIYSVEPEIIVENGVKSEDYYEALTNAIEEALKLI